VKKLIYLLIVAMVTSMLGGCLDNGSSAPPPTNIIPIAGDGRVMLTWTGDPGVDYWLFTATAPSLTAFNWTGLPNARAFIRVSSPFYLCSLFSGTPYYFAMNGRTNGGPGGDSSPTVSATPYDASANWVAPAPPTNGVPITANLNGVGYTSLTTCSYTNPTSAAGSFAAVGAGGAIFTSTDGKTWVDHTSASTISSDLYAVTGYAANQNYPSNPALRWVAVGAGGVSVYSLDGNSWAVGNPFNSNSLANPSNQTLRSLTHVAGTFFAVGDGGTILSSSDGITWSAHNSPSVSSSNLYGVTHGNIYVAVGDSGTILISGDGNTWAVRTPTPSISSTLRQVASSGSVYVAVGNAGTIVTSKDSGATWTALTLGTADLVGVTAEFHLAANAIADPVLGVVSIAQFVAVDSTGNAYTSPNGINWTSKASTGISANALVSSGFGYVAAGNAGATAYAF
jgi:photosystem II stability/assembly factor-like uncharacterized protein